MNGVAPGAILWPDDDAWSDELSRQRIVNQTALKRIGEPDDIAKAVEFLLAAAPFVTGQIIAVDGGRRTSSSADERSRDLDTQKGRFRGEQARQAPAPPGRARRSPTTR